MHKQTRTKDPSGLTVRKQIGWTSRAVSISSNVILIGQITYFCTNILHMDPVLVGALLLASKIFDGVTDIFAGILIDRTHTRWGKARPYEFSILGVWAVTILMFACPDFGTVGKAAWIFITYSLINAVFTTLLNASETVYLVRAFKREEDRNKLLSFNGLAVMLIAVVISMLIPILMGTIATTKAGWVAMSAILGIPMAVIGLGRFFLVPEVNEDAAAADKEQVRFRDFLPVLKDKYMLLLIAITLLVCLITNANTTVGTYYFTYIVGDVKKMSIVSMLGLICPFALLFMPKILDKIGVTKVFVLSFILGLIGSVIRGFSGGNMVILVIGSLFFAFSALGPSYYTALLIIMVMDYHEWKTGKRVEGVISAVNSFSGKVAGGLASGGVGLVMGLAGFQGTEEVISSAASASIVSLYCWIPAAVYLVLIFLMKKFDLEKKMPQIHEELEKRHAKEEMAA